MESLVNQAIAKLNSGSSGSGYNSLLQSAQNLSESVSARNFASAERQMEFQREANAKAMAFSAEEAEKNRSWQERLSNSAHQREVQDLIAAGLNPILSATGGNGAAVSSGAAASGVTSAGSRADADSSAASTFSAVASGLINRMTQQELQVKDLENKMDIAKLQTDIQKYLGELTAGTNLESVGISANAAKYAAAMAAAASRYASDTSYRIQEDFPSNFYRLIYGDNSARSTFLNFLKEKWSDANPTGDPWHLFHVFGDKISQAFDKAKDPFGLARK